MTDTVQPDLAPTDEARTTHFRTCPLCEATCGLEITMKGDDVVRIRGDRDDVFSHGFICPKGSTLKQLHEDPDRLRQPLIKRDGVHVDATWEEAYAEIERRLPPLMDELGHNAVALYFGNPNVHNLSGPLYIRPLIMSVGTDNIFSASTVDQMPRHVSTGLMFGDPLTIPVPDLDRTDYLLMLGANPWHSNGGLATAPDFPGRLKAIQERGGRFVVVDPRRSRTAEEADEHLSIKPGGDAAWLCAIANLIFTDGLADLGRLTGICNGFEEVRTAVQPFSPEAVEAVTGIDAATTRRIAHELASAERATVYGRMGAQTGDFGTVASWMADVLIAITGNLDEPGGAMFPYAAHSTPRDKPGGRGFSVGRHTSRVSERPEVKREFPVAILAEEIETPGEGQIRALITVGGNPALSTPNSERLGAAFASLDFMLSIDPYLNETTRHADVILPPPPPLSKPHYDLAFYGLSVRNVANFSPAIVDTDAPQESEIMAKVALIASGQGADADAAIVDGLLLDAMLARATKDGSPLAGRDPAELKDLLGDRPAVEQVLDLMIRSGPYGDGFGADPDGLSLDMLEEHPHGVDLGPLTPQLPAALTTPSAKVELAPAWIVEDLPRLVASLDDAAAPYLLVGRRHVRSNNSWMHNVNVLVKGTGRCTLHVHPDDAKELGLDDGGDAKVASRVGVVKASVEITNDIRPGVVSLPHGWGHTFDDTRMTVARRRPGVNSNILTDEDRTDPLSGNAVLNGIPVEISPA